MRTLLFGLCLLTLGRISQASDEDAKDTVIAEDLYRSVMAMADDPDLSPEMPARISSQSVSDVLSAIAYFFRHADELPVGWRGKIRLNQQEILEIAAKAVFSSSKPAGRGGRCAATSAGD